MRKPNAITDEQIQQAKEKPIAAYLHSQSIDPVRASGQELVYFSPLRVEKTPSFYVNRQKNTFYDFGGDEEMRGDSIRFVQKHRKCRFTQAVEILLEIDCREDIPFSFSGLSPVCNKRQCRIAITRTGPLVNKSLIQYVLSRGILLKHAFAFLEEVHYTVSDKAYFAVGFKNDNGGYELRNGLGFKAKTANGITVLPRPGTSISVFEGFFDFLSALRYYQLDSPSNTVIVLNTVGNLKAALPIISDRKVVNCFFDNDTSGEKATHKLQKRGFNVKNWSKLLYPTSKDFNEFIVSSGRAAV